jgi:O-antigen ligase
LVAAVHSLPYLGSFSYGGVTALIVLLALMTLAFCLRIVRRPAILANLPIMLQLVFFAYIVLNWYLSGQRNPEDGLGTLRLFFIRGVIPAALILTVGNALERLQGFLVSTVAFSFLSTVMVVTSYLGLSNINGSQWGGSERIALFGFDPISFSLPIGFACVILAHFFLRAGSSLVKPILLTLFAFMFFSIFPTGSRQTILALAFGILAYSFVAYRKFFAKSLASIAVALALVVGFFTVTSHYKSDRFDVTSKGYLENSSFKGRLVTMQRGLDTFMTAPLFGVGAGGHGKYIFMTNSYTGKTVKEKEHIHNLFIELLAEQGVVGLGLFLLPLVMAVWNLWSAIQRSPDDSYFRANAAAVFALLVYSIVQSNISGGIAVSGGVIFTVIAWSSVLAKERAELQEPAQDNSPIPATSF